MTRLATTRAAVIPAIAEAFRQHGYQGTSMSILQEASGLGRGSLYNFFPGGKDEMAVAVLEDIDAWFLHEVFQPLGDAGDAGSQHALAGVTTMLDTVERYFQSGQRVCLPGAFALGQERDRFADRVQGYFADWTAGLTRTLSIAGVYAAPETALRILAAIQGAIVLTRALHDPTAFRTVLDGARALTNNLTKTA
jgi:AcrR family transcriptional regulator